MAYAPLVVHNIAAPSRLLLLTDMLLPCRFAHLCQQGTSFSPVDLNLYESNVRLQLTLDISVYRKLSLKPTRETWKEYASLL